MGREILSVSLWEFLKNNTEEKLFLILPWTQIYHWSDKYSPNALSKLLYKSWISLVYFSVYFGRSVSLFYHSQPWHPLFFCDLWKSISLFGFVSVCVEWSCSAVSVQGWEPCSGFWGPLGMASDLCNSRHLIPRDTLVHLAVQSKNPVKSIWKNFRWF